MSLSGQIKLLFVVSALNKRRINVVVSTVMIVVFFTSGVCELLTGSANVSLCLRALCHDWLVIVAVV